MSFAKPLPSQTAKLERQVCQDCEIVDCEEPYCSTRELFPRLHSQHITCINTNPSLKFSKRGTPAHIDTSIRPTPLPPGCEV
ncbi:hypothetical protein GN956_G4661 [Arapaima gigas]